MHLEVSGHQIEVTQALHDYVQTKLERVGRHFDQRLDGHVRLAVDRLEHKAEATLVATGRTLHADAVAESMYAAIDLLADKLDRLVLKHKGKVTDQQRGAPISRSVDLG